MRQIEVDLDVYSAIWARRRAGEASENDVLRRILLQDAMVEPPRDAAVGAKACRVNAFDLNEEKNSEPRTASEPQKEMQMGKIRWVDDIVASLRTLGGRASLHAIYKDVEKRRQEGGRSVPRSLEAVIRKTLEDHSSDSANFRGEDIFALVDRGEWRLR
jgi:hypothetical protein